MSGTQRPFSICEVTKFEKFKGGTLSRWVVRIGSDTSTSLNSVGALVPGDEEFSASEQGAYDEARHRVRLMLKKTSSRKVLRCYAVTKGLALAFDSNQVW